VLVILTITESGQADWGFKLVLAWFGTLSTTRADFGLHSEPPLRMAHLHQQADRCGQSALMHEALWRRAIEAQLSKCPWFKTDMNFSSAGFAAEVAKMYVWTYFRSSTGNTPLPCLGRVGTVVGHLRSL